MNFDYSANHSSLNVFTHLTFLIRQPILRFDSTYKPNLDSQISTVQSSKKIIPQSILLMDMSSIDDPPLSPIAHPRLLQLSPDSQKGLLLQIFFDWSLILMDTNHTSSEDITELLYLFNSTSDQLRILTEDRQLNLREDASPSEVIYANLSDKLLEMYNKLNEMFSYYRESTEKLISGLDNQIAILKKSIKSIDPTYYGDTLDEDTSPSTPSKRPRLVDSGNSALSSSIDTMGE